MSGSLDGAALRAAIKGAGLKQQEVAAKLGVTPASISQWVNRYSDPSVRQFRALCLVVGVPPHVLLGLSLRQHVETSWVLEESS